MKNSKKYLRTNFQLVVNWKNSDKLAKRGEVYLNIKNEINVRYPKNIEHIMLFIC